MWEELLYCLEDVAECAADVDPARAVRLLSAVRAARERLQLPHSAKTAAKIAARIGALREALGEELFLAKAGEGERLDIREAIAQAKAPAEEPALA